MSLIEAWLWPGGKFLGIEWHPWKVVGWLGNAVFTSRFLIQWYATERQGRVVVPAAFWWCSLSGALLLFAYAAVYQQDSVFIAAYALSWIPYVRNLWIHRRNERRQLPCPACNHRLPVAARYCPQCAEPVPSPPSLPPGRQRSVTQPGAHSPEAASAVPRT